MCVLTRHSQNSQLKNYHAFLLNIRNNKSENETILKCNIEQSAGCNTELIGHSSRTFFTAFKNPVLFNAKRLWIKPGLFFYCITNISNTVFAPNSQTELTNCTKSMVLNIWSKEHQHSASCLWCNGQNENIKQPKSQEIAKTCNTTQTLGFHFTLVIL